MFVRVAQSWLRFHGQLATRPPNPFQHLGEEFAEAKRNQGLSSTTVDTLRDRALTFLRWFGDQHQDLNSVLLRHIDEFLAIKRREGWTVRTIASSSGTLRSFFSYAELRGWCAPGIALGIQHPGKSWSSQPSKRAKVDGGEKTHSICQRIFS